MHDDDSEDFTYTEIFDQLLFLYIIATYNPHAWNKTRSGELATKND